MVTSAPLRRSAAILATSSGNIGHIPSGPEFITATIVPRTAAGRGVLAAADG
ncbi:hypothetical protein [Amycolatopsis keratiniphila]|uniref:hypothetical protein n=1 Tax=Amycolatopsis keratiniphila TaxID=129921 RepID=UPI00087980EB|nr:hypothetical protein [Amycolatopsis keratiniphila]SDU68490.1 hypothetical protein SAMN04489733_8316 [Amycolatopsis keratiniphila]